MEEKYDFSGWATKNNIKCSDGRIIMKDAFKQNDGEKVPLVWNHQHNDVNEVLGHVVLQNKDEGVYAYGKFNDTESGQAAKKLVMNGDVDKLSIYANKLKSKLNNVTHGCIREVSLVLAGANPGAFIDTVIEHGDINEDLEDEDAIIYTGESFDEIAHSDDNKKEDSDVDNNDDKNNKKDDKEKTIKEVFDTLNEEQKDMVYALIGSMTDDEGDKNDDAKDTNDGENNKDGEGDGEMKHNVFDDDSKNKDNKEVLTHSDEEKIMALAKESRVGTFRNALKMYCEENDKLQHGFDAESISKLFPDYEYVKKGAPERIDVDRAWVKRVLDRVHKSPISRVKTRFANLKDADIRAMGYEKGKEKKLIKSLGLLGRSHDPQTVYVKDKLDRDDVIDITDFDIVAYEQSILRDTLEMEVALAILLGDGRADGDEGKIKEAHIQPIWTDNDLYTIRADVDIDAAKKELQGTNTNANFGENYVYAEAIITAALYSREKYRGSGSLDFYCTPHLLNVMLLARDLNGRRIYNSKADLAAALNVNDIHTVEQFENKVRTDEDNKKKKLLGLFVNLIDYQVGSTRGGEITNFDDFDIDFNQYKYLIETRLSGALIRPFAAIALEENVKDTSSGGTGDQGSQPQG